METTVIFLFTSLSVVFRHRFEPDQHHNQFHCMHGNRNPLCEYYTRIKKHECVPIVAQDNPRVKHYLYKILRFFRMRMRFVHGSPQTVACHMGVDLGGRKILMTEQFLHDAQVRPVVEQMRRKAVTDHMRMDMD